MHANTRNVTCTTPTIVFVSSDPWDELEIRNIEKIAGVDKVEKTGRYTIIITPSPMGNSNFIAQQVAGALKSTSSYRRGDLEIQLDGNVGEGLTIEPYTFPRRSAS